MSATKLLRPGVVRVSSREQECAFASFSNPALHRRPLRQTHAGLHECEYSIEASSPLASINPPQYRGAPKSSPYPYPRSLDLRFAHHATGAGTARANQMGAELRRSRLGERALDRSCRLVLRFGKTARPQRPRPHVSDDAPPRGRASGGIGSSRPRRGVRTRGRAKRT